MQIWEGILYFNILSQLQPYTASNLTSNTYLMRMLMSSKLEY